MSENKKGAGFWALLAKGGSALFKGAKFLKVIFAGATFASYAFLFTWKFALLVLIAIGFHESGHVWAMKKMGIKTKGFYFVPFLGGAAIAEDQYKTHGQQAFIAIMGPVWGFLLAVATYVVYLVTGNPLFAAVASWMALVNLFNLLPVNPLDGGQILRTITFSIHSTVGLIFLGFSLLAGIVIGFKLKIGLFAIILIAAALDFAGEIFARRSRAKRILKLEEYKENPENEWWIAEELAKLHAHEKKTMTPKQTVLTAVSYVALIVVLFVVMFKTSHVPGADIALLLLQD